MWRFCFSPISDSTRVRLPCDQLHVQKNHVTNLSSSDSSFLLLSRHREKCHLLLGRLGLAQVLERRAYQEPDSGQTDDAPVRDQRDEGPDQYHQSRQLCQEQLHRRDNLPTTLTDKSAITQGTKHENLTNKSEHVMQLLWLFDCFLQSIIPLSLSSRYDVPKPFADVIF
jgi:hypothetical protein